MAVSWAVSWAEPDRGLFSIAVAAELTGLHPQTLRMYEREGLVEPARSPGGIRRYSPDDIDRLCAINSLTAAGLNLAGVRQVLELKEETRRLRAEVERLRATSLGEGTTRDAGVTDEDGTRPRSRRGESNP